MEGLFTVEYQWLWTIVLALALFLPMRNLIWTLQVRRAQKLTGADLDEAEALRLKKRAAATSGLLGVLFSAAYVHHLFSS